MTASTSSTPRPTTSGTLVAGFPRGRFSASPATRVLSFSGASSTTSPADAIRGFGLLGAREGAGDVAAGRIERSARPLPVAGAGLDQAAQRLVCGAAPRAVLDGHLIARQADRAVDVADRTGPASSRTPYPTAEQAGPQVLRAPVAAALSSPPPDPLPGLAAALRGLTHEAARFPQLHSASSSSMIRYQTDDEGVVSQPEYTLTKPSNGPNDRDHLTRPGAARPFRDGACVGELGTRPHCGGRFPMSQSTAVTADHLRRLAFLYVRQSSLQQVQDHQESTARQYALKRRALALGWAAERVVVIDEDLGLSGASAAERTGFQRIVADVGLGRVGLVMGLEVSRLARNSSDWHRLLEICALGETLILDEDGLYDPAHFNDRLLLGLKGTMS